MSDSHWRMSSPFWVLQVGPSVSRILWYPKPVRVFVGLWCAPCERIAVSIGSVSTVSFHRPGRALARAAVQLLCVERAGHV